MNRERINKNQMIEKSFIKVTITVVVFCLLLGCGQNTSQSSNENTIPKYLEPYKELYKKNPNTAALKWLSEAKYGLFLHYGVYSQLERGEWVMFKDTIHVAEYTKLKDTFDPSGFDAHKITDLALDAGMKYICITTKHHDSFCLWDTQETDFKSTNTTSNRDLIKELAEQCHMKGIALMLYYSYGRDWRHPHGVKEDNKGNTISVARPHYKKVEEHYATSNYDLTKYVDYVNKQVTELLTGYGPIAAIWFDAPPEAEANFDVFEPYKTYELIHKLQPQCLVSAKWGIKDPNNINSFKEDFFSPELGQYNSSMQDGGKPIELCTTLNGNWGYKAPYKNRGVNYVKNSILACNYLNSNLLMNIAPLPNGAIHEKDQMILREVGSWLKEYGWPKDRLHPYEAWHDWKIKGKEAFPDNGDYRPLSLPY